MSDQHDGSIIIDTEIDRTGFKRGSKELESAIKSLTNQINSAGKQAKGALNFDFGKPKQATNAFSKALREVNKEINTLGSDGKSAISGNAEALQRFEAGSENVMSRLSEMNEELERFGKMEFNTPEMEKAAVKYQDAATNVEQLREALSAAENTADSMGDTFMQSIPVKEAEAQLNAAKELYEEYQKAVAANDKSEQARLYVASNNAGGPAGALKESQEIYDKLLSDFENSAPYKKAQREVTDLTGKLDKATAEAEALKAQMESAVPVKGYDTENYQNSLEALQELEDKFSELQGKVAEGMDPSGEIDAFSQKWSSMSTLSGMLRDGFSKAAGAARNFARAILTITTHPLQAVDRALGAIINSARSAAAKLALMAKNAAIGGFRKLGSVLWDTGKAMLGLGKSAKKTHGLMNGGFGTILKYGLGIRSLYMLARKLRSALVDGFKNLAQYSAPVNSAISSVLSSLSQLKNSFATAFAPIVTAVAPYLVSLINLLNSATAAIAQFFAALSGRSTFTKATRVQKDYAKSLAGTGAAAGGAAAAEKEAEKQLAGFDELEILKSNDNSGGGGGGGGGDGGIGDMFTTEEIPTSVSDFVKAIKDAFENGEYREVGEIIGRKINEQFARVKDLISWENVGGTVTKYVNIFCEIFNGLIDGVDWDLIGSTFATGINTVIYSVNTLLTGIDWENLGNAIGTSLSAMFRDIDWAALGQLFGNRFNAALSVIHGTIASFDFRRAGSSLASSVNGLVSTVDWAKLGSTLSSGIIGALNSISTFVQDVDWSDLARAIETTLTNFDWSGVLSALAEAIGSILGGLGELVATFINDAFTNISDYFDSSIEDAGGDVVKGILQGISNALSDIGTWIKENIFQPFIDGFKAAFGIASPAKEMVEPGEYIIQGVLEGILNVMGNINSWVKKHVLEPLKKALGKSALGKGVGLTVDLIKGNWTDLKTFVGEKTEAKLSLIKEKWDSLKQFVGDKVEAKVSLLRDRWTSIKQFVGDRVQTHVSLAKSGWTNIKEFVGDKVQAGVSLAKSGWDTVSNFVGPLNPLKTSLTKSGWTTVDNFVGTLNPVGLSLVKKGWTSLGGFVGEHVRAVVSLTKNGWTDIRHFVGDLVPVAVSLSKRGWSTISNYVGTTVTTWITLAKQNWKSISGFVGTTVTAYISLAKQNWSTISAYVGTAVTTRISLAKQNWSTIAAYVGTSVTAYISLAKHGWSTIANFAGNASITAAVSLAKHGWNNIAAWVGNAVSVAISLARHGWNNIAAWVGNAVSVGIKLWANGWKNITSWVGNSVSVGIKLWANGWRNISSWVGTSVSVGVSLFKSGWRSLKSFFGLASGGAITGHGFSMFSSGGSIGKNGAKSWWSSIPKYASGTRNAHGSMFIAGEAGPEIVGHVGGRTEVLNRSQLASTMYAAIIDAMGQAIRSLGSYIVNNMINIGNGTIASIYSGISSVGASYDAGTEKMLNALSEIATHVKYTAPIMSTGTVIPYEIATLFEKQTAQLQKTLDDNNSELIQTIVGIVGSQTNALVDALRRYGAGSSKPEGNDVQSTIDDINRRTLMFNKSPLLG